MNILVIHGPNLNLLGEREPEIYGRTTLTELNKKITEYARPRKVKVRIFQSNHEGKIIDLRRFKDQVKEVIAGLECGVLIEGFKDIQPDDEIEIFEKIEIKQTL